MASSQSLIVVRTDLVAVWNDLLFHHRFPPRQILFHWRWKCRRFLFPDGLELRSFFGELMDEVSLLRGIVDVVIDFK